MEANRDAASLALSKSRSLLSATPADLDGALRWVKKSLTLYETREGFALLEEVEEMVKVSKTSASAASGSSGEGLRQRKVEKETEKEKSKGKEKESAKGKEKEKEKERTWTKKQEELVLRVRKCKATSYYEILCLEKGCDDEEVKKAYKKLALSTHPDKNSAPGADEAFKMIGKAFSVLGDPSKRRIYDQTGSDPDSRGGGGGGGSGGFEQFNFRRGPGMGGMGGEDLSPEDLFNFFFGGGSMGGMGMGGMGGMGGTTTFYGPGGIRFTSYGGGPRRRPTQNAGGQQQETSNGWLQFLPLIFLVLFTILSNISIFGGDESSKDLNFAFEKSKAFDLERVATATTVKGTGIPYFVNSRAFAQSKIWEDIVSLNKETFKFTPKSTPKSKAYKTEIESFFYTVPKELQQSQPSKLFKMPSSLHRLESQVQQEYLRRLQYKCRREIEERSERLTQARGFLGIGADWEEVKRLQSLKLQSCETLREGGWRVDY